MSDLNYFSIVDFDKIQHYKNRTPPWIKLYNELLTDYRFICLQDASKLLHILLMLLASRSNNRIPADPKYLQQVLHLDSLPDLEPLYKQGLIEITSDVLAQCKQDAIAEREERRGEGEEIPVGAAPSEFDIWKIWREFLQSKSVPQKQAGILGQLIKNHGEEKTKQAVLETIQKSPADPISYIGGLLKPKRREFVC